MEESTPSAANMQPFSLRDIDPTWTGKLPEPPQPVSGNGGIPTAAERRLHELDREYRQLTREHEITQREQLNARLRADMALKAAETALHVKQCESETLRLRFELRQEHSCNRCGHRFNYTHEGQPLPENEWCDVRREHCGEPGRGSTATFNPRCIQKDNATRQAETRTRKAGTKKNKTRAGVSKPGSRSRQAVSHNGHRPD